MSAGETRVVIERCELDILVAVARLYLNAFGDDEPMSYTDAWGYQDVAEIVKKYSQPDSNPVR
ncbi:hypothetical protein [Streptomyces sp. SID3212]|uniref:hypothetical protein n=1 Tax=Streptomyces sp. SID3212 TaxID=2690259 RepID=UPI00136CFD4E|nr:hypothetical protein [Streptomyces sp. SID3212]MYV58016.1 hypothetical protein [Streptomyces sp. SID3212]